MMSLIGLLLVLTWLLRAQPGQAVTKWSRYALAFICGLVYLHWHAQNALQMRVSTKNGQPVAVEGYVQSAPQRRGERLRFLFVADQQIDGDTLLGQKRSNSTELKTASLPCLPQCRLRVDWYRGDQHPESGTRWRLLLNLRAPRAPLNHAAYDAEKVAVSQGIHGYAVVQSGQRISSPKPRPRLSAWRERTRRALQERFPESVAALLNALLLGERADISPEQWRQFADTGTSHLIAISGLHIGLVATAVFILSRLLLRFFPSLLLIMPAQWWALGAAVLSAAWYAAMANFLLPTQRALGAMILLAILAMSRREATPGLVLSWGLFAVLLVSPLAILSPGFYLSFAAVGLLYYGFYQRPLHAPTAGEQQSGLAADPSDMHGWRRKSLYRIGDGLLRVMKGQILLSLGLMPLTLLFFQQFSWLGVVVNLWAVPLISLCILPLAMLMLLLLSIGAEFALLQMALTETVTLLLNGIQWFAAIPHAQVQLDTTWWAVVLGMIGVLWLLAPAGMPMRWLSLCCFLPLFSSGDAKLADGDFWLYQLDVGQGSALAIRTKNHVMLYDTGPGNGRGGDWVNAVMVPTLRLWGRNDIDLLMLSHTDLDHAGGLASALAAWQPRQVMASGAIADSIPCTQGQQWHWDGVDFELWHPGPHLPYLGNDSSCVLSIRSAAGHVLLPGDLGLAAERAVLQWLKQRSSHDLDTGLVDEFPRVDVLIAGHHGSRGSTGTLWLDALQPRLALISRGANNRFGFPHEAVLQRLRASDTSWLDSAHCGGLELRFTTQLPEIVVRAARNESRWWRATSSCTVPVLTQTH
jgi:competence protein ComEC